MNSEKHPLTDSQNEALKKLLNVGIDRAASSINTMVERPVKLNAPFISIFDKKEIDLKVREALAQDVSTVSQDFGGAISGTASLVIEAESAQRLVSLLTGEPEDSAGLAPAMEPTLTEVGNIILNGVLGTLGNKIGKTFEFKVPTYNEGSIIELLHIKGAKGDPTVLLIQTRFEVEGRLIIVDFILYFEGDGFDELCGNLD